MEVASTTAFIGSNSQSNATMDNAVDLISRFGTGAILAKVDLKAAFRMVPIHPDDRDLLGMQWQGSFYLDTCLPFGLRSGPFLFNQFAEALHWILNNNYQVDAVHYLDNFLIVGAPGADQCASSVQLTLRVCESLGIPVAVDKLEGPATRISFLGIMLDSEAQILSLPQDKLEDILHRVHSWLGRRSATKRELLSLIGRLWFASKVVPASRLFLRRLIDLSTTVNRLHHHVQLSSEARADLAWWARFLPSWNGRAMFLDPEWISADSLHLFTDASGSHGFGTNFDGSWCRGSWLPHQRLPHHSIQWQVLFAILAAASTWHHKLAGRRVIFHCDNLAVVQAWSGQSSRDPALMVLLRELFFVPAQSNFTIQLVHVPGKHNVLADALSRDLMSKFFALAPQADPLPSVVPPHLARL